MEVGDDVGGHGPQDVEGPLHQHDCEAGQEGRQLVESDHIINNRWDLPLTHNNHCGFVLWGYCGVMNVKNSNNSDDRAVYLELPHVYPRPLPDRLFLCGGQPQDHCHADRATAEVPGHPDDQVPE